MWYLNIHRIDWNVADIYSSPVKYFDSLKSFQEIDILTINKAILEKASVIIVGGGGLLGHDWFVKKMQLIARHGPLKLIGWGLGHNIHGAEQIKMPKYLEQYDLVGVRDYNTKYEYVPCPSCMHPALEKSYQIKHSLVIYEHCEFPIPIEGYPKMSNNHSNQKDIKKIINFLGSAEYVLTSCFHGAYWAILLNKKVLAIPFSSKFYGLKYKPVFCSVKNWRQRLSEAESYPEALQECRQINLDFSQRVKNLIAVR